MRVERRHMTWYELYKMAADVRPYSEDDPDADWEHAEQADAAFRASNIRPDRDKQLSHVAIEGNQAVGGVYGGWHQEADSVDGHDVWVYSFDVAVHPDHRGNQLTGIKLIQEAVKHYDYEKEGYQSTGAYTMIRCRVINPKLWPILERRYGFTLESELGNGEAFMIRY